MQKVLSVENMRDSDLNTINSGVPSRELMYRAAFGIFDSIKGYINEASHISIVCGSGNNAGDGYALSLILSDEGVPCSVFLCSEKFSEDGRYYYDECLKKEIEIYDFNDNKEKLNKSNIIIDCLLGTGFKGSPRGIIKEAILYINDIKTENSNILVVSCDINSGLNGDNGLVDIGVKSDITVSIGNLKSGLLLNRAKDYIGRLMNVDIGIEPVREEFYLFENKDALNCLKDRSNFSNKGTYGYTTLIGGSLKYSGAIRLAALSRASLRVGTGVSTIAAPQSICNYLIPEILESTIYPLKDTDGVIDFDEKALSEIIKKPKAIAFGMGIDISIGVKESLEYILRNYKGIFIIDADGLNLLSKLSDKVLKDSCCKKIILTPHVMEFSRLTGLSVDEIISNPIKHATEYAKLTNVIVLLKGPTTIVTDGDRTYLVNLGCAGMATAGSGDVLSGVLAGICGYNEDRLIEATATGAFINGLAGELAEKSKGAISMTAGDTVSHIPDVILKIR